MSAYVKSTPAQSLEFLESLRSPRTNALVAEIARETGISYHLGDAKDEHLDVLEKIWLRFGEVVKADREFMEVCLPLFVGGLF